MTQSKGKKIFALYDAGGDIKKQWFVRHYDHTGKRIKTYGTINQEPTAEGRREAARLLLESLQKNYQPPPPNQAQKADLYAALLSKKNQLRPKSYGSYISKLNGLFTYLVEQEVTADTLKQYITEISKTQAPGTVHDGIFTLKRILGYCDLAHLMKGIQPPKCTPEPLRYFQSHQAKRIRDYLSTTDPTLLLFCEFVFYCFIRPRSELRYLRVSDIHFKDRIIQISAKVSKNKQAQPVLIPDAFFPSLAHLQEEPPNRYLFPGKKEGKPIGYNTLGNRFTKVLEHLGFNTAEYSVYSWKHTGAVELYRATGDLLGLQEQLRHHSLDQVKEYLRQLHITDFSNIRKKFPPMGGA